MEKLPKMKCKSDMFKKGERYEFIDDVYLYPMPLSEAIRIGIDYDDDDDEEEVNTYFHKGMIVTATGYTSVSGEELFRLPSGCLVQMLIDKTTLAEMNECEWRKIG